MDNVLDPVDQAIFMVERATDTTAMLQCAWVYNRAVDLDGLRRFHRHLQRGRLARRIERSPLPFGRHRWVSPGSSSDLEIVPTARPREDFDSWLLAQAATPLDSERGPDWHLAVLPLTDGGAGVSLVVSHCLVDGVGLCEALADAASGRDDEIRWPPAGSRTRKRALREDARQAAREAPGLVRAAVSATRMAWRDRGRVAVPVSSSSRTARFTGPDERINLPLLTVFIDADEWGARADSLGGTGNALLVGMAARLAQRIGRIAADGSITLAMPVNERAADDTRGNAVTNIDMMVDPAPVTTDLRAIRDTIKQSLIGHSQEPDEAWQLMPLVRLLPRWVIRRIVGIAAGTPSTVIASNLGAIPPAANQPDGTDADYFTMASLFPGVSKAIVHRTGGRLALLAGRTLGHFFVSVLGYQPGRLESTEDLRREVSRVLSDFELNGSYGWGRIEPAGEPR